MPVSGRRIAQQVDRVISLDSRSQDSNVAEQLASQAMTPSSPHHDHLADNRPIRQALQRGREVVEGNLGGDGVL
jgi:hypothetical protein